jgi:hypothetical protein
MLLQRRLVKALLLLLPLLSGDEKTGFLFEERLLSLRDKAQAPRVAKI